MTIKALIFDLDGTLAETEETHRAAFNATFAAHGLDWHWSRDDYAVLLKTGGGKERLRAFQAGLPEAARLPEAELVRLHAEKTETFGRMIAEGAVGLRPGVEDLILHAREADMAIAMATTTSRPNVEVLARTCWGKPADRVFDVIASGDEVERKKPDPAIYRLALDRLGLPPRECLAFEDSHIGLQSARAAGLGVVITPSTYTANEDFTGAAHCAPTLEQRNWPLILKAMLLSY
ncbi:HAD-IA family hydrolase [Rhodovulum visakhapatnamense]|uniref:HAD superfamily hydrolase (TIGR01509 family) n=1 Tax=Rhodovulum visakhapatnamense TaxID=364297 RepID=A0A4R8G9A4_9RHOB|nr:HAD-IA family hydrolase [Rhodovulum visakhapatnamense]TDX33749.1 HAD superfamily hydrolase (TIGR01509 family) [Rhodovulum visakhapatnamense]